MEHQDTTPAGSALIPADVRARIIEAANQLFEESGEARFPAVADVRRLARTDMNATSAVMREWKRQQTAKPEPVAVSVPEAVQQAGIAQLAVVWSAAQELANASLRSAQASWAVEREEMEAMRQELSQLFEAQAIELEDLKRMAGAAVAAQAEAESHLVTAAEQARSLQSRAELAEARLQEAEHWITDLKESRERAELETVEVREELTKVRLMHLAEIEAEKKAAADDIEQAKMALATAQARAESAQEAQAKKIENAESVADALRIELEAVKAELATVKAKADAAEQLHREQKKMAGEEALRQAERFTRTQTQRDNNAQEAAQAREQAAHLAGQVETLKAQCAALTARLGGQKK